MNIQRADVINENLTFFETALQSLAARHFFLDAVRCKRPDPQLSLAGLTCLLCGIEGCLRFSISEKNAGKFQLETVDLDKVDNFNNDLLKEADQLGFDIEVFAFPEESKKMREIVTAQKVNGQKTIKAGIVEFRNEFSHGRAYRAAEKIGDFEFSDSLMLGPQFREMLEISYLFSRELARFRGFEFSLESPRNPFDF